MSATGNPGLRPLSSIDIWNIPTISEKRRKREHDKILLEVECNDVNTSDTGPLPPPQMSDICADIKITSIVSQKTTVREKIARWACDNYVPKSSIPELISILHSSDLKTLKDPRKTLPLHLHGDIRADSTNRSPNFRSFHENEPGPSQREAAVSTISGSVGDLSSRIRIAPDSGASNQLCAAVATLQMKTHEIGKSNQEMFGMMQEIMKYVKDIHPYFKVTAPVKLPNLFPLRSKQDLDELEEKVAENNEIFNQTVMALKTVGGMDIGDFTKRTMPKLLANSLALDCNIAGIGKGRIGLRYTVVFKALFAAAKMNLTTKEVTERDLEDKLRCWLNHCRDRYGGARCSETSSTSMLRLPFDSSSPIAPQYNKKRVLNENSPFTSNGANAINHWRAELTEFRGEFQRNFEQLKNQIKDLKNQIINLKQSLEDGRKSRLELIDEILPCPVETKEHLLEFECQLSGNQELKQRLVNALCNIGGRGMEDTVRMMMRKIANNSVWERYCLRGNSKTKDCFETMRLYKSIRKACMRVFPTRNEKDFAATVSDFLTQSTHHKGGSTWKAKNALAGGKRFILSPPSVSSDDDW